MADFDVAIPRNLPKGTLVDNLCVSSNLGVQEYRGVLPNP